MLSNSNIAVFASRLSNLHRKRAFLRHVRAYLPEDKLLELPRSKLRVLLSCYLDGAHNMFLFKESGIIHVL